MSQAHTPPTPSTTPITVTMTGPARFELTVIAADATRATVQLHGEMDLASADLLTAILDGQLAAGRRFVRLDLSRLGFLDGAGLRALREAHDRLLAAHGMLTLTGIAPPIARLLHITHLDQTLYLAEADQARCAADQPAQSPAARQLSAVPRDHTR